MERGKEVATSSGVVASICIGFFVKNFDKFFISGGIRFGFSVIREQKGTSIPVWNTIA